MGACVAMKLGVTMYSFNSYFRAGKIDVTKFIEFCGAEGVEAVDLLAYYWKNESREPEIAAQHLRQHNIELAAYAIGNNFVQTDEAKFREQLEMARRGIAMAKRIGARTLRVFGGHAPDMDPEEAFALAVKGLSAVEPYAREQGITLAVENHGGIPGTSEQVLRLLREIDSPAVQATVDLGNFLEVGQSPNDAISDLVPFAAHVHAKDFRVLPVDAQEGYAVDGADYRLAPCALGKGDLDYDFLLQKLYDGGYTGSISIEAEGPEDDAEGVRQSIAFLREKLRKFRNA